MLLYFEVFFKKNNAYEKKVYAQCYILMVFNILPNPLHFCTPVNIIKNDNSGFFYMNKYLIKVIQCWLFSVVAINKSQMYGGV